MAEYKFIVFTNAVAGEEREFNEWYDNQHLRDVLAIPGVVAAQRLTLAPVQRTDGPHRFKYCAIYEIETEDLKGTFDAFEHRSGTPLMPGSKSLDPKRKAVVYQVSGPKLEKEAQHDGVPR